MKKTGLELPCAFCGEPHYVAKWESDKGLGKYCSRKCKFEASKGSMPGIGSKYTGGDGYVRLYYPTHPDADSRGRLLEHRWVAEQKYGRRINKGEHIHHINGIRDDNRPENLEVIGSGEHAKVTAKIAKKNRSDARAELTTLRRKVAEYEKLYGPIP